MFGGAAAGSRCACRRSSRWLPAERLQREYDAIGFFLSGHPLDDYAATAEAPAGAALDRVLRGGEGGGATAGRLAATVRRPQERRTKTGNKMGILALSDPIGAVRGGALLGGAAAVSATLLEPGARVVLQVSAEVQGEDVRARIQTVEPLDEVAAAPPEGPPRLRARRGAARQPGAAAGGRRRRRGGLVLMLEEGQREVEMRLPGRYKVTPQIAGAIKAIPGVVMVQDL